MDGIEYLENDCRINEIDPEKILKLGRGSKGSNHRKKRYEFGPTISTIKDTQLHAVQYYEDDRIYIAWDAAHKKHPFSLKVKDVILLMGKKRKYVQ